MQLSLSSFIRANSHIHCHKPALIEDDRIVSHGALEVRTNRLARHLLVSAVGAGDRIALLLPDGVTFVELLIAAGKIGAIAVLLNWRLAPREIENILSSCTPKAIYYAVEFEAKIATSLGQCSFAVSGDAISDAVYERWTSQGPDSALSYYASSDTPLFMMFTSGTTGQPKGCVHTHGSTLLQAMALVSRRGFVCQDVSLSTNPLFHVAGLGHLMAMLAVGGTSCFVDRSKGTEQPLETAARQGATIATLSLPLLAAREAANGRFDGKLKLKKLTGGAGMSDPCKFAFVAKEWDAMLTGGYGQTESWGFVTFIDYEDMVRHPTSIGWPLQHVEAAILDNKGQPVEDPDAEGELGIKGPCVMSHYWNDADATIATLGTGWLRTGDMARRDELGLLHMLGRLKELVKSGGENVYPAEVETILKRVDGIADVAVAGVQDAKWGEAVKAFIVLKQGAQLDVSKLVAECRESMAGYKRPRYLEIVDEIPRDPMGKVRRFELSGRLVTDDQKI
jgi:acyl-CoA synthetase (AMP-forming)/AMP-acid ligase II